jgi:hypothetical protein
MKKIRVVFDDASRIDLTARFLTNLLCKLCDQVAPTQITCPNRHSSAGDSDRKSAPKQI